MSDKNSNYPTWRQALRGNGHAANLYCAIKYGFWHGGHLLLAAALLGVWMAFKVWEFITSIVPSSSSAPNLGVVSRFRQVKQTPTAKKVSRIGFGVLMVMILVFTVAQLAFLLLTKPVIFGTIVGVIILLVVGGIAWTEFRITERLFGIINQAAGVGKKAVDKGSTIRKKSEKKPITRRILGYCPVHLDLDPKWFEALEERLFGES